MFYVALQQVNQGLQHAYFIGPFTDENEASDCADNENTKLSLRGIPSWVASFYVTT